MSAAGWLAAFAVGVVFALWLRTTGDWNVGLPWERALLLRIDRTMPALFDWAMLVLPWFGTNITIMPALVIASIWLIRKRRRYDLAAHLTIVHLGSISLNSWMKAIFDRPRPDLWQPRGQFAWASYPSGHAIAGVSVLFTIAILLHRERGWRWPYLVVTLLLAVNLYSRLYLGVHWPSDVIGGVVIGVVWLAATVLAFSGESSHAAVGERSAPPSGGNPSDAKSVSLKEK